MDETKRKKLSEAFAEREYEIGQVDRDALYKGYYHGMKDSLSLPITDRLTDEEKEEIRTMYASYRKRWLESKTEELQYSYFLPMEVIGTLFPDIVNDLNQKQ